MSTFSNTFNQILALNGINEPLNVEKFEALYTALTETNKQYNLTAVTDETGVAGLHFADSLMALPYLSDVKTVLDIGCGAGFPCLPIAIARPNISVTGVDSTAKKVDFSNKLALKLVTTVMGRVKRLLKNAPTVVAKVIIELKLPLPLIFLRGQTQIRI